jgi:hypothetical protein
MCDGSNKRDILQGVQCGWVIAVPDGFRAQFWMQDYFSHEISQRKKIPYKRKLSSLLNCDKPDLFNFIEIGFLICYDQACNVVTAPSTLFGRVFMIKICDVYFYLLRWSLKNIGMLHFVADKMWILCKRAFCWCYCKHFEH